VWIILLFTHLICNTGYNTVLRHAASDRKLDPLFLSAIMSTAIAAPAAVGIFITGIEWAAFSPKYILPYIAAGTIGILFHFLNAKALERTEASVFSFLYNFRIGIVTVLGVIFLGEPLLPVSLAGGAMVFAAGFILMGKSTARPSGVMLSISTALMISVLNLLEKYLITGMGYTNYMFTVSIIEAIILWLIVIAGKRAVGKPFAEKKEIATLMVFRSLSAYGFTLALAFGAYVSIGTYISALICVTIPIAAVIFLKEKDSLRKKTIAGVIALVGVTLVFVATR